MFNQLVGLLLVGLGLQHSVGGTVAGDTTNVVETTGSSGTAGLLPSNQGEDAAHPKPTRTPKTGSGLTGSPQSSRSGDLEFRKNQLQGQRQEFEQELKTKRQEAQAAIQKEKSDFQAKLSEIKDARKQAIVEKVNTRLGDVNTNRTTRMTDFLGKMTDILQKVIDRAAAAKANGKDTSSVDSAVASAQSAISDAQAAVVAQAGKTYTITIGTDATLKGNVGTSTSSLQSDLKAVYDKVVAAKKAVGDAVRALAHVLGEPEPKEPSPALSPTTVPTVTIAPTATPTL